MIRELKIGMKLYGDINPHNFKVIALVDTQPGTGNSPLPKTFLPTIVFDHHPLRASSRKVFYTDIRPHYGSTCTILTEYIKVAGIALDKKTATALLYGIKTDTENLGRHVTQPDIDAFLELFPIIDVKKLYKIEHPKYPRSYFKVLSAALARAKIYGDAIIVDIGGIPSPDMTSQIADTFSCVSGINWCLVLGEYESDVYFSLRTSKRTGKVERIALKMVKGVGSAGGHHMTGGGKAPAFLETGESTKGYLVSRFLSICKLDNLEPKNLVPKKVFSGD